MIDNHFFYRYLIDFCTIVEGMIHDCWSIVTWSWM